MNVLFMCDSKASYLSYVGSLQQSTENNSKYTKPTCSYIDEHTNVSLINNYTVGCCYGSNVNIIQ